MKLYVLTLLFIDKSNEDNRAIPEQHIGGVYDNKRLAEIDGASWIDHATLNGDWGQFEISGPFTINQVSFWNIMPTRNGVTPAQLWRILLILRTPRNLRASRFTREELEMFLNYYRLPWYKNPFHRFGRFTYKWFKPDNSTEFDLEFVNYIYACFEARSTWSGKFGRLVIS